MRWLVAFLCVIPLVGSAQLVFRDGFETVSYTVGGQVQGLVGEGLVLRLNAAESLPIQVDGPFTFAMPVPSGGDYAVDVQAQPSNPMQDCQVADGTGVIVGAPVTDVVVTCAIVSTTLPTSPGLPFAPAVEFLYTGPDAPQSGVDPADIDADRVSVLSGRVLDGDGAPLPGATVVVLDHPEFGSTLTDVDGGYALAVNGGGELVVDASHPGLLPAQRRVGVPWNAFVPVDDMALVALDPVVTTVTGGNGTQQLAVGSTTLDARGERTARMLFPAGTGFEMVLGDGSAVPLAEIDFRITEYTVGDLGPVRMPGELPPTSAYTYAIELSADEAIAAGARAVVLDQPAWFYVDNFLGFPAGEIVPYGYYSRADGAWFPADNGRVLAVVDVVGGVASLDVDGDGLADGGAALDDLGIGTPELEAIATQFGVGESFWRVPMSHFSPHDLNWPYVFTPTAEPPPPDEPEPKEKDPCDEPGSVIECPTRVLREHISLAGADTGLHWASNRAPGFERALTADITVAGSTLPVPPPVRSEVIAEIAGQRHVFDVEPVTADASVRFTWDRQDLFGRTLQSRQPLVATVRNYYEVIYTGASTTAAQAFGVAGDGTTLGSSGVFDYLETRSIQLLGLWDARGAGFGGWTLGLHHALDPTAGVVYEGTGVVRQLPGDIIDTLIAPTPSIYHLSVSPDGSILANGPSANTFIKRIQPDGSEVTIAGGSRLSCDVQAPAFPEGESQFDGIRPTMMIEAPDGTVVFTETNCDRISRLELDGSYSPVAGTAGMLGYTGDGGPAVDATLFSPRGLALGPEGSIYFSDAGNAAVRRIGPDGIIETVAGGNGPGYTGDGGPATAARLLTPGYLALGPDGSLYVVDQGTQFSTGTATTRGRYIRRIAPDGIITTIAGDGTTAGVSSRPVASGVPATSTGIDAEAIVVSPEGDVVFIETVNNVVRRISPDGIITTIAGVPGVFGSAGDGGPAIAAEFFAPVGIDFAPDGRLLINDRGNQRIRDIRGDGVRVDADGNYLVPSVDAREVYVFDGAGLHRRTVDALGGATIFSFEYDAEGRLVRVDDPDGTALEVVRPAPDTVVVTTATGEVNTLTLDASGYLASLSLPGGETRAVEHDAGGLLARLGDFRGNDGVFTYDALGLLESDQNRLGFAATLADNGGAGLDVTLTDVNGGQRRYASVTSPDGVVTFERESPYGGISVSQETPAGGFLLTVEDGLEVEAQLAPDPRWGAAAPYLAAYTARTPAGLELDVSNDVQVTLNGGDPLDVASLTVTTTYAGHATQTTWNGAAREATTTTAEGVVTKATYDAAGRLVGLLEDAALDPAVAAYDAAGRLTQVTRGPGVFTRSYDAAGRLVGLANNAGLDLAFTHDANGLPASVTSTGGATVAFTYTDDRQVETITLPSMAVHAFDYHPTGDLASYTAPGLAPLLFAARNDGSLAGMTLPGGRVATRTFDAGQRPTGWVTPETTVLATYVTGTDHVDTTTWTPAVGTAQALDLDHDGHLVTDMAWSGVSDASVALAYDGFFRPASMTLNGGTPRTFTRDGDARIVADGPFTWQRANPRRAMSSITDGTAVLEQTLNGLGLLESRTLTVNGMVVHELSLDYRADRRVEAVAETLDGAQQDRVFVYDVDNRLVDVTDGLATLEHYGYDANDNRTLVDLGTPVVQAYDAQDRLTSIGGVAVIVNDDGQTTAIGADSFSHGTRGELLDFVVGGSTVTFTYDGFGRRVARTEGADTTLYVYGDPTRQFRVTHAREPDGTWLTFYYDETDMLYAIDRDGAWYYVGTDHRGSPRVVADATGTVVKVVDYSAYGVVLADSNPALELHIGFAGGLREPRAGLVRFALRDYDPQSGRWLTRDPLLFRGGSINPYSYGRNDPVNLVDRVGLSPGFVLPAGGLGGSLHVGFGGKLELSSDGAGGYGICFGVGVGAGYSVGIDPGARPQDSLSIEGGFSAKIPGTPAEFNADTAIILHKCPPGSARENWIEFKQLSPAITAGPITLGPNGVKGGLGSGLNDLGGLGAGASSSSNFTACAKI